MKKIFLLLFSAITLFANIGVVVDVVGNATIQRGSNSLKVTLKQELKEKDVIKTSKDAKVKIFFKDNTAVSLGQNTTFSIENYMFDGTKESNVKFKVLKGFFKTVTGKIGKVAPNRFKLQTKNATIGIRGTVFAAKVGDEVDVVMCTDGSIILFTPNGDVVVDSGNSGYVKNSGEPRVKHYSNAEKKQLIENAGWHGSMSMSELREFIKKNFKEPLRSQLLGAIDNIYAKDSSESKTKTVTTNADDIGFVDDITINGREFDELPEDIVFYRDDLKDGKVIVQGLLESEDKAVSVDALHVEITTDGGDTWSRATGSGEWEWSFEPNLEEQYEFSLRVVQDANSYGSDEYTESEEPEDVHVNIGDEISIAGFTLALDADVSLRDGKLSGSGKITIPYLSKISNLSNEIDVDFDNLSVVSNIVTLGDITYDNSFDVATPLATLHVNSITFSPTPANNKIVGSIDFKDTLGTSFGEIDLPQASKFLPTSFALNIPFESKVIDIWKEKSVAIAISSGSLDVSYNLGDDLPKAKLNIPTAQFKFGDFLKYASGLSVEVGLGDFGKTPSIELPNEVYLMDTGIKLPSGLSISFDLNDYTNPKFTFSSSVNLEGFTNEFAKNLQNANLSVTVQKTGLEATLTGDGTLNPVTLLNRGSDTKSVKLLFEGDSPSFHFSVSNSNDPLSMSLDGITPKIQFGDLFTNEAGTALNKVVSLGSIETPTLNLSEPMYLLGSKIKLPSGFSASVDLSDLKAPILDFDIGVDFQDFDNIVAKHISGAKIAGRLSKDGFRATVTSNKPSPISIYEPKGVKIVFSGESGPSFGINITGTESLPDFSISNIEADLDFGTLLTTANSDMQKVIASIGVLSQNGVQKLRLTLPAKVRLMQSKLMFGNIVSSLDLKSKNITIASTVDLSEYTQNPVLKALNGADFDMSITPSSFTGSIQVDDELEPIGIWPEKEVVLNITGKPSIGITVDSGGVGFDFGKLNASLDFGLLLKTAKNGATSVVATFSQLVNDAGNYSVKIENDVYLLGSAFALKKPQIDFNPNIKSITLGSSVDLGSYTEPMIKAFDGASFSATVTSSGFSGSLSKEGGFEPIVVLDRGGDGKDVSVEFTSSPTISVSIKNSGLDFGFGGGSADIHFGDLLSGATATMNSLEDGLYSWGLSGKNKLIASSKAYIENIKNAKLDIKDLTNPKISFDAGIDLSGYGGVLSSVKNAKLKNVEISKSGFKASASVSLGTVNIWEEKQVKIEFQSDPTIDISIDKSGFGFGLSDVLAEVDFGSLLDNTKATIGSLVPSGSSLKTFGSKAKKNAKEAVQQSVEEVMATSGQSWSIIRNNIPLMGSKILLSNLGGSIDFSDFSNPSITFNATADMHNYGAMFKYVKSADFQNVTISKEGISGSLITSLNNIDIWKEKRVKVVFNKSPEFYIRASSGGLKVGAKNIDASVHMGTLLNESIARLSVLRDDFYSWQIDGKNKLGETSIYLSNLKGAMNFGDLKDPKLLISEATIKGIGGQFRSVSLTRAEVSKEGFDAYISAEMDDINLYTEDTKKVDLRFDEGKTPTLHLKITREETKMGLSSLNAGLVFTNLLNNATLELKDTDNNCAYDWSLSGSHEFINDTNGVVLVSNIGGEVNLCDWTSPEVVFHTVADFTNYNFSDNLNLGIADVTRAEIKKTSIKWNVTVENARASFTILELGNGANDDVRVELRNVSGSANNAGASVSGADGTLFFGKLFTGNKSIGLTYQTSDGGLKTYGFSFSEDVVYKKDDNNFITLISPSGTLVETADGIYKVVINSQVIVRSAVLSAMSIGEITASNLEVSSSGFKGDIAATFNNVSKSILEEKASIALREVGIHIDSSLDMPIKLSSFDGDLDLQYFFDEDVAKAAFSVGADTSSINWTMPSTLHVNTNFEFKNLSGTLNLVSLDELSIGLNGNFGYKSINQDITLDSFTIGSAGIAGTINWTGSVNLFSKLDLKNIEVAFGGVDISGTLGVEYSDDSFLSTGKKLDLGLSATIDKDGIDKFSVDGDLSSISIPNFAVFNFTKVEASPSLEDFWISLDGTIKPQHSVFSSDIALEFEKLKISSSGISMGSAEASAEISGADATLGGFGLSITELGLGFDSNKNLFYIRAYGGLSLDIIGEANAGVAIYSDKTIKVDEIAINIHQSGLVAEGSIAWYDNDEVYGDGFKATLGLGIAQMFTARGMFRIGQKDEIFYWMANATGGIGSGVPFGALTLYEAGGGAAYHMIYDETKKDFIPEGSTVSLMVNAVLGTSGDAGYLWNGNIEIIAAITDGTLGQLNLNGYSWVLASRGLNPSDRQIEAHITHSPSMLHVWASANIKYKGIAVNGSLDAVFSPAENHVFVGTDDEYAYAFNIDRRLGHVSVGLFGLNGDGFFMVDTRAIAFGMGVNIDKKWSKNWWGPDPSLSFKFIAGAKALIIYNPFQMNIDLNAEVSLRGCYGGCVSIGADVLVKFATPDPYYIWGRAGVRIFGTSMTFKGFIYNPNDYSASDLQPANEAPDIKVFDRVDVPYSRDGASLIPLIKIYSKFQRAQTAISIAIEDITLKEAQTNTRVSIREYYLDGDVKGTSYMPTHVLKKNTDYVFSGKMIGTYVANGERETKEKEFIKTFKTTSSNRVSFAEIVKSITPANGNKDVHEDAGVKITYNKKSLELLDGVNSHYVKDYKIELKDADGNDISGVFSEPDRNLVSKFQPSKDLRIYRYCKNEEGEVRETFVLNGVFLNPFNDYSEDDGDDGTQRVSQIDTSGVAEYRPDVTVANTQRVDINENAIVAILAAANSNSDRTALDGVTDQRQIDLIRAIPTDLRIGNLTFAHPQEALGELVYTSYARGKSYSYYRANKYNIVVKHKPTGDIAHRSNFEIRYNNIPAESRRKVEQMQGNLEPTFTVSLDEERVGRPGIYLVPNRNYSATNSYNGGFFNEVRTKIDDGLLNIGVYAGVRTRVYVTWDLENEDGTITSQEQEWTYGRKILLGIVRGYSARIQYISEASGDIILDMPMELISGEPFNSREEEDGRRKDQVSMDAAASKAKDAIDKVGSQGVEDAVGVSAGGFDGGFSHVGGGNNPMGLQGAFGNMNVNVVGETHDINGARLNGIGADVHITVRTGR